VEVTGGTVALNAFAGNTTQATSVSGRGRSLDVDADAGDATSYQWMLNGSTPVEGATSTTLLLHVTAANVGTYTCVATNSSGSATSSPATVTLATSGVGGRLVNISARSSVGTGGSIIFGGFAINGPGSMPLLIRASGPAIAAAPFNVPGTLPDPQLQLFNGAGDAIPGDVNDAWAGNSQVVTDAAAVGAFTWGNPASHDAALDLPLSGGTYTAQVSGESGDTGVAIMEVYDATLASDYGSTEIHLSNLSARVLVGSGSNALFAGFVIKGSTAMTVLIRASGPALAAFNITGFLPDPMLTLQNQTTGATLAINAGWGGNSEISSTATSVGAFGWSNPSSNDSALLITLPPGNYTAEVAGVSGDTGIALVEVYQVP
jgi:hypothetical protein